MQPHITFICGCALLLAAVASVPGLNALTTAAGELQEIFINRSPLVVGRQYPNRTPSKLACYYHKLDCFEFTLCDETTMLVHTDLTDGALVAVNGHDNRRCEGFYEVCCKPSQRIIDELLARYERVESSQTYQHSTHDFLLHYGRVSFARPLMQFGDTSTMAVDETSTTTASGTTTEADFYYDESRTTAEVFGTVRTDGEQRSAETIFGEVDFDAKSDELAERLKYGGDTDVFGHMVYSPDGGEDEYVNDNHERLIDAGAGAVQSAVGGSQSMPDSGKENKGEAKPSVDSAGSEHKRDGERLSDGGAPVADNSAEENESKRDAERLSDGGAPPEDNSAERKQNQGEAERLVDGAAGDKQKRDPERVSDGGAPVVRNSAGRGSKGQAERVIDGAAGVDKKR